MGDGVYDVHVHVSYVCGACEGEAGLAGYDLSVPLGCLGNCLIRLLVWVGGWPVEGR